MIYKGIRMKKRESTPTLEHPKTVLIAVQAPYNKTKDIDSYFSEFIHLISSNDIEYCDIIYIKLREIDSGYFLTKGKVEEVRAYCEKNEIADVVFSEPLTAQQERNLTDIFHCRVFDRAQIILELFERSAHSAEGKLQVEIAMLRHNKTRTTGKGISMSQQSGHKGNKGPGETARERELRCINDLINKLQEQLKSLEKTREQQRKQRLDRAVPHVCLIGYTNSGKSSLLNNLTKADVLAQNKLFSTLDTTTREFYIDGKKKGIISDTVGFIQMLPPLLVEAFKSTISELRYADLLLHVIDSSDKNWEPHIQVVNEILKELKVDKPILYIFNKTDKINVADFQEQWNNYIPHVAINTLSKAGIEPLVEYLRNWKKDPQ